MGEELGFCFTAVCRRHAGLWLITVRGLEDVRAIALTLGEALDAASKAIASALGVEPDSFLVRVTVV